MITAKTTLTELAALISEHLKSQKIGATLVGGAVVSIYSENEYQSKDLDFISSADHRALTQAMELIGFTRIGKDFHHPKTRFTVEFPSGPLALGNEIPVQSKGKVDTPHGVIQLLSPTQCVQDRLAWFYHYNDRQCLDQALAVAQKQPVNLVSIKKWSEKEGAVEKFELFRKRLADLKK